MLIRVGFEIGISCSQPTPMTILLSIHPDRRHDIVGETGLTTNGDVRISSYRDVYGNDCRRCLVPAEGWYEWRTDEQVDARTGTVTLVGEVKVTTEQENGLIGIAHCFVVIVSRNIKTFPLAGAILQVKGLPQVFFA